MFQAVRFRSKADEQSLRVANWETTSKFDRNDARQAVWRHFLTWPGSLGTLD